MTDGACNTRPAGATAGDADVHRPAGATAGACGMLGSVARTTRPPGQQREMCAHAIPGPPGTAGGSDANRSTNADGARTTRPAGNSGRCP